MQVHVQVTHDMTTMYAKNTQMYTTRCKVLRVCKNIKVFIKGLKNNWSEHKNMHKSAQEAGNDRENANKVLGKYQESAGN